jgi:tetratricopeptide (TPR) repeat protein
MNPLTLHRRGWIAATAALLAAASLGLPAHAAGVDDAVQELQQGWESIRYQTPTGEREKRFEALATRAHALSTANANKAETLIWEGIIVSSWAGEKGGLGALPLVKQAKALYEEAIQINDTALDGSAYNSLGVLYHKVPGWPIGFGDKKKASEMLQKALSINPQGIDANFFYGEYLLDNGKAQEATLHLQKALAAPERPGRALADQGRREEARALLQKAKAS